MPITWRNCIETWRAKESHSSIRNPIANTVSEAVWRYTAQVKAMYHDCS